MAKNRVFEDGRYLYVDVPADTVSGDPVVFGDIPGVAEIDRDSAGKATIDTSGVYSLAVKGKDAADANAAVSAGDIVYYDGGDINLDDTNGTRFGYALEAVTSGATATIKVKIGY
ncbi:MAG: DUF2190 family protein [Firmicutes bacterium]|nr:DUF2190 family protein [Bacillota bacterium]